MSTSSVVRSFLAITLLFVTFGAESASVTARSVTADCGHWSTVDLELNETTVIGEFSFTVVYDPAQLTLVTAVSRIGESYTSYVDVGSQVGATLVRIRPSTTPFITPIPMTLIFAVAESSSLGAATVQITDVRSHLAETSYLGTGTTFAVTFNCPGSPVALLLSPSLAALPQSSSSVELSWSKVPGAGSYALYRGTSKINEGAGTRFVDADLGSSQEYCYTVRSIGETGESVSSNRACATTKATCVAPATAPEIIVAPRGMIGATLVWNAVPNAIRYLVFRDGTLVYDGSATTFNDRVLSPSTKYCYTAQATNSCGSSATLPPVCVTTAATCTLPAGPPAVATVVAGASQISLSWADVGNTTGYRVTRNGVTVYTGPATSFVDSALRAATPYCYEVAATNACGDLSSLPQCLTTRAAPRVAYSFSRIGGTAGGMGSADGVGPAASFHYPYGVASDSAGNLYVADTENHVIRKVTPAGAVSTLAGAAGRPGSMDGTGALARFNKPSAVAVDGGGNIYVTEKENHTIRKVTAAGVVTTLAGSPGLRGRADGTGSEARFNGPMGIALDAAGNLYVADTDNHRIRKVTPGGVVTTRAGEAGSGAKNGPVALARFMWPNGVAVDGAGNVFVADSYNHAIRKISTADDVSTFVGNLTQSGFNDGQGGGAHFDSPTAIAVDAAGNLYVADSYNAAVRKVTPSRVVTTIAGGGKGYLDGPGGTARFFGPASVAVDAQGSVFVADTWNSVIRKISTSHDVTTFAGAMPQSGSADGSATVARFKYPEAVATDRAGNVYVADGGNYTIRKITTSGIVSTLAGTPGKFGTANGTGAAASFYALNNIAADGDGNVFVADSYSSTIRKITPAGVVTTFAGEPHKTGASDGSGSAARFYRPDDVAADDAGNVYVADGNNCTIRKISPAGVVSTLAGVAGQRGNRDGIGADARFVRPYSLAVDPEGNVYVADVWTIRKITPSGAVTTLAGMSETRGWADGTSTEARLAASDLAVDPAGNVLFVGSYDHTIRKVTPSGVVTHLAGRPFHSGNIDGDETVALFNRPEGIAIDRAGNVYIAEAENHTIRRATTCASDALCLDEGNFTVSLTARDPRTGETGSGMPIPQTDLFGFFSLPDLTGNPGNPEVFVKLLDGRGVNGSYWVFHGGLTDLEYVLIVTDRRTNEAKAYRKEPFGFCGGADTEAFPRPLDGAPPGQLIQAAAPPANGAEGMVGLALSEAACAPSDLCFANARFNVRLSATDPRTGHSGSGMPIPQNDLFGFFSLPELTGDSSNPEVFVKVLDGRAVNGRFWVFYGGLTDFEYTITVSDSETGGTRTYTKPPYTVCGGADTSAF